MSKATKVNLEVSPAWANFMLFAKRYPFSELKIEITQGEPRKLLEIVPNIRFDKPETLPKPPIEF